MREIDPDQRILSHPLRIGTTDPCNGGRGGLAPAIMHATG